MKVDNNGRSGVCKCPPPSDKAVKWIYSHPRVIKIMKIAALILTGALLIGAACALTSGVGLAISLGLLGVIAAVCTVGLFALHSTIPPAEKKSTMTFSQTKKANENNAAAKALWESIESKSLELLEDLKFLDKKDLNHRFGDIRCPKETAIAVDEDYLHANRVGNGVVERAFVASQAPLPDDYELFWKAVCAENAAIVDLTTFKDRREGGVTKYYPEDLNATLVSGEISVKLVEVKGQTYTYQTTNAETSDVKTIKRLHFANWKDFGAVSVDELHKLVQDAEALCPDAKNSLWIHCRAGVGRTGTLITALALKEKVAKGLITKENLDASLEEMILAFRKQRGPAFVQQEVQLKLLRDYANFLLLQKVA